MDKFILTHLIKEILLEKGRAVLPGFGQFSTAPESAYFSEDGRIINPPTCRIIFTEDASASDDQLLECFACKLGESADTLRSRMNSLILEIKNETKDRGFHNLIGFGTLTYSDTGIFSFTQDVGKDLFQERLCMEPIQLRPIERVPEPAPEPAPEPEKPAVNEPVCTPPVKEKKALAPEERRFRFFLILIIVLSLILISAILLILGRNGTFDSILYSDEDLKLIESLK